ncbi:sensor histidine kinase [Fulvivirga lutea]|uniref:histidine kinase n=1 Tax=Fulvivirga lutea TaxID=2810512 RepID=A0A974WJ28_9BACT|nr:HAMP domain-containing sensor histidine kinase [Fulvivirga lutea]QSE98057.1 HAMP domain-containing histidine kinase [Fulvivirga lutea]
MKRKSILALVVMAAISILGIVGVQVYWFNKAFNTEEELFNREVNAALYNVATKFFEISETAIPANNPIKQLSTNYYVVMINNEIDANLLEYLLKSEFEKRNIKADFEYGIYDCTSDKMVYGNYVSVEAVQKEEADLAGLPKWENQNYYFGVQFPNKASIITDRMEIWIFSSAVLVLVIIFFSYALFVILKQKRLSEIQKDFINNMTHEFKTPISTIALSADVLSDPNISSQPERIKNYTTIIKRENVRLKKQVERVLQMAGMDKDEIALKKEKTSLHKLINEAVEGIAAGNAGNKNRIQLQLNSANDNVEVDRLHVSNVIYNLIDNALKYCEQEPKIVISTESVKDKIWVTIEDNGIGISQDDQKKVFDKFYRVSTGNRHDVKGFGLGLSYVMQVVKAHKGSLKLMSELGKGSTFKFSLYNE